MAKYVLEEATDFTVLPVDAIIGVQCTDIQEKFVPGKDGKEGWTKLEFTFEIDSVPSSLGAGAQFLVGSRIWGSCSARFTMHPDNKLRQWVVALMGVELNKGFELDTDVLLNRKARAVIGQYTKQNGTSQHQVKGLLPLVQSATPSSAPQQSAMQPTRPADLGSQTLAAYGASPVLTGAGFDEDPPF